MFREHARLYSALQFGADLILTGIAFVLAYFARLRLRGFIPDAIERLLNPELMPLPAYLWIVLLATIWWSATALSLGLYRPAITSHDGRKARVILESSLLAGLFLGFLSFALKLDLSRALIALFVVLQAVLLLLAREAINIYSRRGHVPSWSHHNVVIVGGGPKAREMGALISRYSDWGLRVGPFAGGAAPPPPARPGTPFYFHLDHLGSTGVVTTADGAVNDAHAYFPDGEPWIDAGPRQPVNGYLFSGKQLDTETGLYDFGQRFYDPRLSLWLGTDPLLLDDPSRSAGHPLRLSPLAYGAHNPLRFVDPDGRDFWDVVKTVFWDLNPITSAPFVSLLRGNPGAAIAITRA